jgi:hypothetical protein
MPNMLAYGALLLWPVVTVVLFHKLPVGRALIASLLVGYMFLPPPPAGFDFPLMPALTKDNIPALVAFIMCLVLYRPQMTILPASLLARILLAAFILSPLFTVLTNLEPIPTGVVVLPALRLREAVGMMVGQAILITPFLMARNFLIRPEDHRDLLFALFLGCLIYSPLMLLEVRLAPQLNIWIYGYFQHVFAQMIRGDGFRPIVFMQHGLWVAFFATTAILAGVALARGTPGRERVGFLAGALYLLVVLILCKSLAALIYALAFAPLVMFLGTRMQIRIAMLLGALALAYPIAKGAHLVPDDQVLSLASSISTERADSLQFRFDQEEILLDHAYEKPLFGWGLWGRHHIYDAVTGYPLTITDGRWVVLIGMLGWVGFLAEFGLLVLPSLLLWWRSHGDHGPPSPWLGPMMLMLAVNIFDLIPNATITPLTWLMAGAVLGQAERYHRTKVTRVTPLRTVL